MHLAESEYHVPDLDAISAPMRDGNADHKKYKQTMKYFDFLAMIVHAMGAIMICLNAFVYNTWAGGLQWSEPNNGLKNYHGFFMTIAFIFFQGEALLAYRIHRHEIKMFSKTIHGTFHLVAIGLGGFGLAAMIRRQSLTNTTHLTTYHSWIGVGIIAGYCLQFIVGFVNYAFPKTPLSVRKTIMPLHTAFGMFLLFLSMAQVLIGNFYIVMAMNAMEKPAGCRGKLNCDDHLDWIHNFAMIAVVLYVALVAAMVVKPSWKRRPTLDEKHE